MVVCGVSVCGRHGVFSSVPLAFKMLSRGALGACHHLKFSLYYSFRLCSFFLELAFVLLLLDVVQLDVELSVHLANSLTIGPRETLVSLVWARSPGVPVDELDAGSWDDADGAFVGGPLVMRSGCVSISLVLVCW